MRNVGPASLSTIVTCVALAVVTLAAADKNDGIAWGEVDHGLRFGLAFGPSSPEPQLRLIFQNLDRAQCLLPLGSESAKGPVYDIEFRVKAPDGKESPLFNFNGPPGIQPAAKPIILDIPKGAKHEILLSAKKLIYVDNGKNRPLTELLAQHYSVRASVDTSGDARWSRALSQWMGKVSTGELKK